MVGDNASKTAITIAVCTYNRSRLLRACLSSLEKQQIQRDAVKGGVEVIIVDNASSDDTQQVAAEFVQRNQNWRVIREINVGLSNARNRAWRSAKGPYIGYIDDDAKAPSDWMARTLEIISIHKPGIFGGAIYPYFETPKPSWFRDSYEIRCSADTAAALQKPSAISGSNMFFRRELLQSMGGFDPKLGMRGTQLGYGEETQLITDILKSHPQEILYYDPKLLVQHLTPAEKMRVSYFLRSRFQSGRDYFYRLDSQAPRGVRDSLPHLLASLRPVGFKATFGLATRDRQMHPHWQTYIVEEIAPDFIKLGRSAVQTKQALKRVLKRVLPGS